LVTLPPEAFGGKKVPEPIEGKQPDGFEISL